MLHQLVGAQPAPELELMIWDFLLYSFQSRYLAHYRIDRQFLALAAEIAHSSERVAALLDVIDQVLEEANLPNDNTIDLLVTKLDLLDLSRQEEAAQRLIDQHLSEPQILLRAVHLAQEKKDAQRVKQLATTGLGMDLEEAVRADLEDSLLELALSEKDQDQIRTLSKSRFLSSYQKGYWEQLKAASGDQWPAEKAQIIQSIQQLPFSVERRDALASIYADDSSPEALLRFFATNPFPGLADAI